MASRKGPTKVPSKKPAASVPVEETPIIPAATPAPAYRVLALQSENIKRLSFVRIRPKGDVVMVSGDNASGKTSLLDSLSWALTGERQLPSHPIRSGQKSAKIEVDLGDLKVVRTFTRIDGGKEPFLTRLAVFGKNRENYPTPQAVLDKLRSVISFDPLAFIGMKPDKQLETLRKLVTVDVDLDQIDADKAAAYDERRQTGRDIDSAKARLAAFAQPPEGLPEKPIDTASITAKLESAAADNNRRAEVLRRKVQLEEESGKAKKRAFDAAGRAAELRKQAEEMDKVSNSEVDTSTRLWEESQAIEVPAEVSTAELAAELNQANTTNNNIQVAKAYKTVEQQVADAEAKWTELDERVKAKEKERADAIARAKMPIEKLGIGEGEVLYDSLPFSQASNAEQIRIAVALAMASNPQLRLLLIRDGSLLDKRSLALIEQMAHENNFQVWIERVGSAGQVGIVMEDGEATGEEVEAVLPAK